MKTLTSPRLMLSSAMALCAVATAAPAFAGSFYLQEQSVRGAGRAYSGETADTGASSLWWNPASIARSGRELYVGAHALALQSRVANTGSSLTYPGGATVPVVGDHAAFDVIDSGVAPNFAFATPIGDRFALGVSVAAPYNFTTEYEPTSFARYDALKSKLLTVDAGLTLAARVNDWLDVGVGVSAQYADATLTSALPNLSPALPDGKSSLEGDGWNYGWNVGAQVHKGAWDFGLAYRSAIEHDLDGKVEITGLLGPLAGANVSSDGSANFSTPWYASASVRYAVTDKLTLNAQVNRIGWSEFKAITVEYPTGGDVIHQNYDDVTTGAVGFDYAVNDTLTLRGGVAYDPTPTPDGQRTARIPDADRILFSVGGSAKVRENLTLDGGLTYIAFQDSDIHDDRILYAGTPAAVTSHLRGESSGSGVVASVGMRMNF